MADAAGLTKLVGSLDQFGLSGPVQARVTEIIEGLFTELEKTQKEEVQTEAAKARRSVCGALFSRS
jgi:hypothetical protein